MTKTLIIPKHDFNPVHANGISKKLNLFEALST